MMRDIFPLKNNNKEPETRIDCGTPSMMELLSGKQAIAFAIKGKATFEFDLPFRLYQHQLENYVKVLEQEYPDAKFSVSANTLHVTVHVDYLCDTYPLTTPLTAASCVHSQTWIATRNATRMVDDIYSRVLELHIQTERLEAEEYGIESITATAVGYTGKP